MNEYLVVIMLYQYKRATYHGEQMKWCNLRYGWWCFSSCNFTSGR